MISVSTYTGFTFDSLRTLGHCVGVMNDSRVTTVASDASGGTDDGVLGPGPT